MRAKPCANPAVPADYRFFCFLVKVDGTHDACGLTLAAANTFIRYQQHTATVTVNKGVTRAYFHTSGLKAREAHDSDETACHSSGRPHLYGAFDDRVVFLSGC